MVRSAYRPLRFDYPIYPVWRRSYPALLKPALESIFRRLFPVEIDRNPPQSPEQMARYLRDWAILRDLSLTDLAWVIDDCPAEIEVVDPTARPRQHDGSPVYLPAQWDATERVLVSFGTIYPPLWSMQAEMIEALSQVAMVEVLVTTDLFARAVRVYLQQRNRANLAHVRLLVLPTGDIWLRNDTPVIGIDQDGYRVAVHPADTAIPDMQQNAGSDMTLAWAAHHGMPVQPLHLDCEGGSFWSDGRGTLMTSEEILHRNQDYDREALTTYLHEIFDFEKLILLPHLTQQLNGHTGMGMKLASADTIFVSAPESTSDSMRRTRQFFERETGAAGQCYNVVELPTPPLYRNWFVYRIRRSYTDALIVNHRVLVPVYGLDTDETALRLYQDAMPDCEIIPLDSRIAVHGGGAVQSMAREIPCE